MNKLILHSDMNNYYASIECLYNPRIRDKPVAVVGDAEARHGIVLAKNQIAKRFGVKTGDPIWLARQKCREIVTVPPHFDRYLRFSSMAREIYGQYTNRVESYGLDECWMDLTGEGEPQKEGRDIADRIRRTVRHELGITASIGVSYNKIFAKLGSDYQKPDATTVITQENYREVLWPLPASDLLFVGPATTRKLACRGVHTIGELANADPCFLHRLLGKNGLTLWQYANGRDSSRVAFMDEAAQIKSIGNSTTAPRDLVSEQDIRITLYVLCESVAARLRAARLRCTGVQVGIRDFKLYSINRQGRLARPCCDAETIFKQAFALFHAHHTGQPVRSLSVKAFALTGASALQLSLYPEAMRQDRQEQLETALDEIRRRFGNFSVRRCVMLADPELSRMDPQSDHIIHPVPFIA